MSIDVARAWSGSKELSTWAGAAWTRSSETPGEFEFSSARTTASVIGLTIADAAAPTVTPRKVRRDVVKRYLYLQVEIQSANRSCRSAARFSKICHRCLRGASAGAQ